MAGVGIVVYKNMKNIKKEKSALPNFCNRISSEISNTDRKTRHPDFSVIVYQAYIQKKAPIFKQKNGGEKSGTTALRDGKSPSRWRGFSPAPKKAAGPGRELNQAERKPWQQHHRPDISPVPAPVQYIHRQGKDRIHTHRDPSLP